MDARETIAAMKEAGLSGSVGKTGDVLKVHPPQRLTRELVEAIKQNKVGIIRVVREDEEDRLLEETGIIQSERQVSEMARKFFGNRREKVTSFVNAGRSASA